MKINHPKIFYIKSFRNHNGQLFSIEKNKNIRDFKRVFYVKSGSNALRGKHAHKKCTQIFYPIFGKIKINIEYKKIKKNIILDHKKSKAFILPPKIWCSVDFLSKNSIVLVLNDYKYDYNDYIESYKEFTNYY